MRLAVTAPMPDDAPVISAIRSRTASSSDSPLRASSTLRPYSGAFRVIELGRFSACETAPTGLPIRSRAVFAGFIVRFLLPFRGVAGGLHSLVREAYVSVGNAEGLVLRGSRRRRRPRARVPVRRAAAPGR